MTTFKKILIGIDNSKYAEHAAKTGFELAKTFGAKAGLVHVVEPTYAPTSPASDPSMGIPVESAVNPAAEMEMIDIQNKASDDLMTRVIKDYAGDLEVSKFKDYGSTADGILHCCGEFKADLIVIGTHSRSGLDRLLMGSVAEHVVRHAEVPVLVVPFGE